MGVLTSLVGVGLVGGSPVPDGVGWTVTDAGDYQLNDNGDIERDPTIATRCRFMLKCRRGQYVYNATLGSRLWQIKTLRDGKRNAETYIREALQPLVDEGLISDIEIGEVVADYENGALYVAIAVEETTGQRVDLGLQRIGQ